jgi:mycofactocin precursor
MIRAIRGELMSASRIEAVKTVTAPAAGEDGLGDESLVEDSLVEEVSIDGMCGVY